MSSSNSVKNELRKIEQDIAKIYSQEKKRKKDLLRYQKKRASDHRRTKKRIADAQKNVNRGTRKNRPVLKAPSSPVDKPYTMDQDIIQKYAVPSNFTGSPTISEGEFDSLSPPNYMQNMPSLTGFKLTAENLANMERGNEMNLARQIRDSQAMPVPSSEERERARLEAEFAEQEAEIAKEEAILAQENAITQRMGIVPGFRITSQDERDIKEELAQMVRDAEGNRKRRTSRKHKGKRKKAHKKRKTHKKKKKRRKKKGGTRKKKGGTRKNRRR